MNCQHYDAVLQFRWNMVGQTDASPPTPHHRKWSIDSKVMKDTSMYLKMRMSTLTPHSSYIVFGLQSRPAVSFTHMWVCTTNQMKSNIQHFWKQLSVLHNIIIITVILSLWTKMVKCSSYHGVLGNKVFESAGVCRNLPPVWVWMVITGV